MTAATRVVRIHDPHIARVHLALEKSATALKLQVQTYEAAANASDGRAQLLEGLRADRLLDAMRKPLAELGVLAGPGGFLTDADVEAKLADLPPVEGELVRLLLDAYRVVRACDQDIDNRVSMARDWSATATREAAHLRPLVTELHETSIAVLEHWESGK